MSMYWLENMWNIIRDWIIGCKRNVECPKTLSKTLFHKLSLNLEWSICFEIG